MVYTNGRVDSTFYIRKVWGVLDKSLFFVALGFGAAGIVGLKYLGIPQTYVTIWPISLMILYAVYIKVFKRFALREDVAGDNLYYLGFLYTLTSLAYALYLFAAEKEGGTAAIISNFGIALATTILGLALRVVFYQMRTDPMEVERSARLELSEAASRLKTELYDVVADMNAFRRGTQQAIIEGIQEIATQSKEEIGKIGGNVSDAARGVVTTLNESFASFEKNAKLLDAASKKTAATLIDLIERLNSIETPTDLLEKKLDPAIEGITEAVNTLQELAKEDQKQVRRLSRTLDKAIDSAQLLDSRVGLLNQQMQPLEHLVKDISEMGEDFKKIPNEIEGAVTTLSKAIEEQETALTLAREAAQKKSDEAMQSFTGWLQKQANTTNQLLKDVYYDTEAVVKSARTNVEQQVKALNGLFSTVGESLKVVRKYNQDLETELGRSREITEKVQTALTSMAELLIEKLGSPDEKSALKENAKPRVGASVSANPSKEPQAVSSGKARSTEKAE
jgi:DNA repair exonuclease SbcCD ATPase subunit